MKRSILFVFLLICLVICASCSEKQLDPSLVALTLDDQPIGAFIPLEVETAADLTVDIPLEEVTMSISSASDNLVVTQQDNRFTLIASVPGDYELTLAVEAKGYRSASVLLPPVKVEPRPMSLSIGRADDGTSGGEKANPDASDVITIIRGETLLLTPEVSADDAHITAALSDASAASCTWQDGQLLIEALYPGEATLTLTASKENYQTVDRVYSVVVEPTAATLSLSQGSLGLIVGGSGSVTLSYQQGGTITLDYDSTAINVVQSGSALTITGLKTGQYSLSASCAADGYKTASVRLPVTVSPPSATVSAPGTVALRVGESKQLALRMTPADAEATLATTGTIKATYQNGIILVEGTAKGSGSITVTASREGYQSASAVVIAAVEAALPDVDTATYANLASQIILYTNQARQAAGLSALSHISNIDPLATVRAGEASQLWSHTRPNGRDCLTIFDDYDMFYRGRGENLCTVEFGPQTVDAKTFVDALMDSPTHRENILRPEFTGIGIGVYYYGGAYYVAQLFVHD